VKVTETVGEEPAETERVVFDGLQEVSFSDDAGSWKRSQATTRRLDEVLASSEDAGSGATTLRTHHGDLIQSGTLAMESAAGGGPTQRTARWRAFGELLEGDPGEVGFVGRPAEVGGMVPLRARGLAVAGGVFLTVDPIPGADAHPASQNRRPYVWNRPVAATDPTGTTPNILVELREAQTITSLLVAGVIALMLQIVYTVRDEYSSARSLLRFVAEFGGIVLANWLIRAASLGTMPIVHAALWQSLISVMIYVAFTPVGDPSVYVGGLAATAVLGAAGLIGGAYWARSFRAAADANRASLQLADFQVFLEEMGALALGAALLFGAIL
jgi:hypothetical protein